jgi:pyruvate kinase
VLREMMLRGMDVCRLNFSHGSYDFYAKVIGTIREVSKRTRASTPPSWPTSKAPRCVWVKWRMAHRPGGWQRTGHHHRGRERPPGHGEHQLPQFPQDVKPGRTGPAGRRQIALEVMATDGRTTVTTKVLNGGRLSANKGLNLPNTKISLPCLTEKDKEDLDLRAGPRCGLGGPELRAQRARHHRVEAHHPRENKHARVSGQDREARGALGDRRDHPREPTL